MKQDHKRLSKEKHEIAYVRKLARGTLKFSKETVFVHSKDPAFEQIVKRELQIQRLCKAVLKFAR